MLQRIVRHRILTVALAVAVFVGLGLCLNAFTDPVYRAAVRIEFARPADRTPWTGQLGESGGYQSDNQSFYTTAELLTSHALLDRLARTLPPDEVDQAVQRAAAGGPAALISGLLHGDEMIVAPAAAGNATLSDREDLATLGLRMMVSVEPLRDTRLVDLKVEFPTRDGALDVADRLAGLFVRYAADQVAAQDTIGLAFLTHQLVQVERRLAHAENDSNRAGAVGAAARAHVARLEEAGTGFGTALASIETDRIAAGARIARLRALAGRDPATWIHEPIEGEVMEALRHALVDVKTRIAAARAIYRDRHPKRLALEAEREALEAKMREELPRAIAALEGERSVLAAREADLRDVLSHNEHDLGAADQEVERDAVREAERKADQDLQARLLTAVADRQIEFRLRTPPARIVDAATCDADPVRPRKALNLAVCLLAGLLVGGGVVLLGPPGPVAIQDPRRLEEELGLPVVAVVPRKSLEQQG